MKLTRLYKLIFLLLCILIFIKYFVEIADIKSNYLPVWSDEFGYYLNSLSFYLNKTLEASFTISGKGAKLLGANVHGFMYPLTHGTIAFIFGWNNLNMVITNLFLLFLSALYILKLNFLSLSEKLFSINLILAYPTGFLYAFTYMQEVIHILFAILASSQLYLIYSKNNDHKKNIIFFIIIVIFATLYRPTWTFALVTLIPIAKSRKESVLLITIVVVSIFAGLIYGKYFFEFVPNFFNYAIGHLQNQGAFAFVKVLFGNFIRNVYRYFLTYNYGPTHFFLKLTIIINSLAFLILAIVWKKKIFKAISLLYLINIIFLLFFYDAHTWRDVRFLSPLIYFSIIIFAKLFNAYIKLGILISIVFFFLIAPIDRFKRDRDKFDLSAIEQKRAVIEQTLGDVDKKTTVQINFIPKDYSLDLLILPVRANNNLIKYIAPYYDVKFQKYNFILENNQKLIPMLN